MSTPGIGHRVANLRRGAKSITPGCPQAIRPKGVAPVPVFDLSREDKEAERCPLVLLTFSASPGVPAILLSLLAHTTVIALLFLTPAGRLTPRKEKFLETIVRSPEKVKLVWYRVEKTLPEVSPANTSHQFRSPELSAQKARQTIIAKAKEAESSTQMVWQPVPQIQLKRELKVPNLVAFKAVQVPPPPPKPTRQFTPPPPPKPPATFGLNLPQPVAVPAQSKPAALTLPIGNTAVPPPPPPKVFVPPAPSSRPATAMLSTEAPPEIGSPGGNANLTAVVVGLNPAAVVAEPIPPGSRAANLSTSQTGGGQLGGGAGTVDSARHAVPNLMIQGRGQDAGAWADTGSAKTPLEPAAPPPAAPGSPAIRALPSPARFMLSAPLRPSSRRIPPAIDELFRDRVVYTSLLETADPLADIPIWFAERKNTAGSTIHMRPPVPRQAISLDLTAGSGEWRLAGVLRRDGRLESLVLTNSSDSEAARRLIDSLQRIEFLPAVQLGNPVDVDIVFVIRPEISGQGPTRARPSP